MELNSPPIPLKDLLIVGASGGDQGVRNWIASLDAKTGNLLWKTYSISRAGRARQRDVEGRQQCLADRRRRLLCHRFLRSKTNITYWGSGNPVPGYDAKYRPGDNLYTSSALAIDAATGEIRWFHQYTPNDNRDYDETGTHILIDTKVNGEDRKIARMPGGMVSNTSSIAPTANSSRPRNTSRMSLGPRASTRRPASPLNTIRQGLQAYADKPDVNDDKVMRRVCPDTAGGNNYWPATYSRKTGLVYIPTLEGCSDVTPDFARHVKGKFEGGSTVDPQRITSSIVAVDPSTGVVKARKELDYAELRQYALDRRRDVVTALIDGTIVALDDQTLDELWRINVGTGFNAPPMTFAVNGKQYIAIASGLWRNAKGKLSRAPELRNLSNATMIFVFGL